MSPWDVVEFRKFLEAKEKMIKDKISSTWARKIVDMVFQILFAELEMEFHNADVQYSKL